MPIDTIEIPVLWGGVNVKNVLIAQNVFSDTIIIPNTVLNCAVSVVISALSRPAKQDDYIDLFMLSSAGNLDGTGTDKFDSAIKDNISLLRRIHLINANISCQVTEQFPQLPRRKRLFVSSNYRGTFDVSSTIECIIQL